MSPFGFKWVTAGNPESWRSGHDWGTTGGLAFVNPSFPVGDTGPGHPDPTMRSAVPTPWKRRALALRAFVPVALALTFIVSCTLLTDFNECETDDECVEEYGPRATCAERICEVQADVSAVTTQHCPEVVGDLEPETFLIAVLLPLSGPEAGFGIPLRNAIETALDNFNSIRVDENRNVALLMCDTRGENETASEAGRQAIEEARVSAIIGPDFSSQTIEIAQRYAIPNDVLMISPSATSVEITNLDDDNLVWRTAPSDETQSVALAQLVIEYLERSDDLTDDAAIWVLYADDDAYGRGLQESLVELFPTELTDELTLSSYPDQWEDWFLDTAQQLPAPDIAIILGAAESWDIAEAVDDHFDTGTIFFFADAARNPEEASVTGADLEGRILGTAPQNVGDPAYRPYTQFRLSYEADHDEDPDELQFVANAYDALHLVVLAAAGGGGITGPELAVGMARLSEGESVAANSQGASRAVSILRDGGTVDFEGASGRVDFDENGDPSPSKIVLWCFLQGGVPEAGDLLSIENEFTYRECGTEVAPNNDLPDMGGEADMGMEVDMGASDMGTQVDMDDDDASTNSRDLMSGSLDPDAG